MANEKTKLQKGVKLFTSNDYLRPELTVPHIVGGTLYAANLHSAIALPVETVDFDVPVLDTSEWSEGEKVRLSEKAARTMAQLQNIYEEAGKGCQVFTVLLGDLKAAADSIASENIYDHCEICEGNGEAYCHACKHSHICDTCNGSGNSRSINGTHKPFPKQIMVKFGKDKVFFGAQMVDNIVNFFTGALNAPPETEIEVQYKAPLKGMLFSLHPVNLLIMPMWSTDQEDTPVVSVKAKKA